MTTTLTDFLLARIAEDEADAETKHDTAYHDYENCHCNHPARVLAECEAKRRIVGLCTAEAMRMGDTIESMADDGGWDSIGDDSTFHITRQEYLRHREILRLLALPSADHPDYREEWKP